MTRDDYKFSAQVTAKGLQLGYAPEALPLLFLTPLVRVAWSEGFLQAGEQKAILRFAGNFDLAGQTAYELLLMWFDERPEEDFFEHSLADLRELLDGIPAGQAARWREKLALGCLEVAQAAGGAGFRGDGSKIHPDERESLSRIGDLLGLRLDFV